MGSVVVLDVDGVLSPNSTVDALTRTETGSWPPAGWVDDRPVVDGFQWNLPLHTDLLDAVSRLRAPRVWLTTWNGDANVHVAAPYGWDPLPIICWETAADHGAKLAGLIGWLDVNPGIDRVVWIDDALLGPSGQLWMALADPDRPHSRLDDVDLLPVPTIDRVGLLSDAIDEVNGWLTGKAVRWALIARLGPFHPPEVRGSADTFAEALRWVRHTLDWWADDLAAPYGWDAWTIPCHLLAHSPDLKAPRR